MAFSMRSSLSRPRPTPGLFLALAGVVLSAAAGGLGPGGTFVDDDANFHEGMIEAIVAAGVTQGCDRDGPRYCPDDVVTRAQMASFLARGLGLSDGSDRFLDDAGSVHEPAINALAAAGITLGCSPAQPSRFCPEAPVRRGQMAAFLQRAFDYPVPTDRDTFVDDDGTTFEAEIEAIAAGGVTTGCDATRYCPFDPVRRDQMATFLGRALELVPLLPPPRLSPTERMSADVAGLVGFGPRVAGSTAEAEAATWITGQLTAITGSAHVETVPLPNGTTSANVWAKVGIGPTRVLIGGHYDSVTSSPGADDNASGLAVILEIARNLAASPPEHLTVTVAGFGAEERLSGFGSDDHHFGSRLMADRLAAAGELPDYMVSVDMVGVGDELWAVIYQDLDPAVADLLVAAGSDAGVKVTKVSGGDISDHEGFARAGVPAAFLWRPDNPAWHTPEDATVSGTALAADLAVMLTWLARLDELAAAPTAG